MQSPVRIIDGAPHIHRTEKNLVVSLLKRNIKQLEAVETDDRDYRAVLHLVLSQDKAALKGFSAMPVVEDVWVRENKYCNEADACPKCGERDQDKLVWIDDYTLHCTSCHYDYKPD